jgi:hypothetical protein
MRGGGRKGGNGKDGKGREGDPRLGGIISGFSEKKVSKCTPAPTPLLFTPAFSFSLLHAMHQSKMVSKRIIG